MRPITLLLFLWGLVAAAAPTPDTSRQPPIRFEANLGQFDSKVQFSARGRGYAMFLTGDEASMVLSRQETRQPAVLRMRLLRGLGQAVMEGLEPLPTISNYLVGNDPVKWRTRVPNYGKVLAREVYPGIDLVFYGREGRLEYDFVVNPGADPRRIELAFEGADRMRVDRTGNIVLETPLGGVRWQRPIAYQVVGGARRPVEAAYVLRNGRRIGFELAGYRRENPLIIDPVLSYSTYLGGTGDETGQIVVDASGSIYLAGLTTSTDLPIAPGAVRLPGGQQDFFVAKFNPEGTSLAYVTYLGGSGNEGSGGGLFEPLIAVDGSGSLYLTGNTTSSDYPTTQGAFLRTYVNGWANGVLTKLNATGTAVVYSTYLGDTKSYGLAVNSSGNAYVAGTTYSSDFVTTPGAYQTRLAGSNDAFVMKMNLEGSAPVYSTLLGGSGLDYALGIALDQNGNAYVDGSTDSNDFPTTSNAYQRASKSTPTEGEDAFVTKLNPAGSALVYSTYLGGRRQQGSYGIKVDSSGNAYVPGITNSIDFPTTPGVLQVANSAGVETGFIAKLDPSGSSLVFSTYFPDSGLIIALDSSSDVYVAGARSTIPFPATGDAIQQLPSGLSDAYVAKLNAEGTALTFFTYLGGRDQDGAFSMDIDPAGNIYIAGGAGSGSFPVTYGAVQTVHGGLSDAFVAKIAPEAPTKTFASVSAASFARGPSLAAGAIAGGWGSGLAPFTEAASAVPLPTSLAGTSVKVKDSRGVERLAPLFFVSETQINYQVPEAAAPGPSLLSVVRGTEVVATGMLHIDTVVPGLFSANADGRGVAAAIAVHVRPDGSQSWHYVFTPDAPTGSRTSTPIDMGPETDKVILLLFGTGIRGRSGLSAVTATVGGFPVDVEYAGPQPDFVGLDQANLRLPRLPAMPHGEVDVVLTVDERPANRVTVNIK